MAAITTRKDVRRQENNIGHLALAPETTIPEGALVGVNSDGYAVNAVASTAARVVGVASITASNVTREDDHTEFWTGGVIRVNTGFNAVQADVASYVKVVDNQTVAKLANGDNASLAIGRIVEIISSTQVRIALKTI